MIAFLVVVEINAFLILDWRIYPKFSDRIFPEYSRFHLFNHFNILTKCRPCIIYFMGVEDIGLIPIL